MSDLNDKLLAAHSAGNKLALVELYTMAADQSDTSDAEGFFLTHAYVFALEINHPDAPILKARLVAAGRDRD